MAAKRILILTNRVPYPLNDGGNLAMRAMVEGYHKAGWQVYLLSMNTSRHYVERDKLANIYKHIHAFDTVDINNEVTAFAIARNFVFSTQPNHAERFYNNKFADKLTQVIRDFQPDVIQVESVFLATYLPQVKRQTHALTILRLHNIEYQVWSRLAGESKGMLKKAYLGNLSRRIKVFEIKAWQLFDLLLPITETDAEVVRRAGVHTPAYVAPFGINIGSIPPAPSSNKLYAYHIGAMDWLPNEEGIRWFLQEVWPLVRKQQPEIEFFFAGRNMPASFAQMDIEGVHCMGEVDDAAMFISDKSMLVVPIRSGGGIRVKILEAMAAGKIVISTDIGIQGIDALSGVHYIAANTPAEFVAAFNEILKDEVKAVSIRENARKLVWSQYNERAIMNGLLDKVKDLLG